MINSEKVWPKEIADQFYCPGKKYISPKHFFFVVSEIQLLFFFFFFFFFVLFFFFFGGGGGGCLFVYLLLLLFCCCFYTPGFHVGRLCVCPSVRRPSVRPFFSFPDDNE